MRKARQSSLYSLVFCSLFLFCLPAGPVTFIRMGVAPDFGGIVDGRFFRLYKHRDKVVFLDFFSVLGSEIADLYERQYSPCEACLEHLRVLEKVYQALKSRDDVIVMGISVDFRTEWVKKVLKDNNLSFPIVYDPERLIMRDYEVEQMPTSFLIKDLYVKAIGKGAKSMECYLQRIMNVTEKE